jgi:hypothetical protein
MFGGEKKDKVKRTRTEIKYVINKKLLINMRSCREVKCRENYCGIFLLRP